MVRCQHVQDGQRCEDVAGYGLKPGQKKFCKGCATKYYPNARNSPSPCCHANKLYKELCWKAISYESQDKKIKLCTDHYEKYGDSSFVKKGRTSICESCGGGNARKMTDAEVIMVICPTCRKEKYPNFRRIDGLCIGKPNGKQCMVNANYNFPGESKTMYCNSCKLTGMIDVKTYRCGYGECGKMATYRSEDGSELRCEPHKDDNMATTKCGCQHSGCKKYARYTDIPNSRSAKFCSDHSDDTMYCTIGLCKECFEPARYGVKIMTHCEKHYDPETMKYYPTKLSCVGDPKCKGTRNFGQLFGPRLRCGKHKIPGDMLRNNPKCEEGCKERPEFTNVKDSSYPLRCENHALDDDVRIVPKICDMCKREWLIADNLMICDHCIAETTKNIKKKELMLFEFLESRGYNITLYDMKIEGGCTTARPDFLIKHGLFNIIVECDEKQHKGKNYPPDCEIVRMKQLFHNIGEDAYLIFIRFNPDSYKKVDGKAGREREATRYKTLDTLLQKLFSYSDLIEQGNDGYRPEGMLTAYYLYYDNFDKDNIIPVTIDI